MQRSLVKPVITGVFLLLLLFITSVVSVRTDNKNSRLDASTEHDESLMSTSEDSQLDDSERFVTGLEDAYIELIVPDILPLYETLFCNAAIIDAKPEFKGLLIWSIDGKSVLEKGVFSDTDIPSIIYDFEYSRHLPESIDVKVALKYFTEDREIEEITAEATVLLENYSKTHWMEQEAERVLENVTDRYLGDFTLQWAIDNDYTDFDKETFVNMKGYESKTEYLLWVNLTHQRTNVFKGSAGEWELIECFIVGTGAPGSGTKRGVTAISRRQPDGWDFGGYIVTPVVRFWPGTGYAFHSRKLHPVTREVTDSRIGRPVSAGCVRMYCEDIRYIFDNIPDETTVVIH